MHIKTTLATLALAAATWPAAAQEPIRLLFSDSTTADVPRSRALTEHFAPALGDDFEVEAHFGATLMPQGSELTAIQRGNLQIAILPPSDFAQQVPAFGILGAAYVVRDAEHMKRIFESGRPFPGPRARGASRSLPQPTTARATSTSVVTTPSRRPRT